MADFLFTSESVTEGHPDKICDQVSDAILDEIIAADPACRVACETVVKTGFVLIAGEITTTTYADMPEIVRKTIDNIGYTDSAMDVLAISPARRRRIRDSVKRSGDSRARQEGEVRKLLTDLTDEELRDLAERMPRLVEDLPPHAPPTQEANPATHTEEEAPPVNHD